VVVVVTADTDVAVVGTTAAARWKCASNNNWNSDALAKDRTGKNDG
jgi:hypothetical protein